MDAAYKAFGLEIGGAMLSGIYGPDAAGAGRCSRRRGGETDVHCGTPVPKHINTSNVECQNLTIEWACVDSSP